MLKYTALGNVLVPSNIQQLFFDLSKELASSFTLRTLGTTGTSKTFLEGHLINNGTTELYLPFNGYQGQYSTFNEPTPLAKQIANKLIFNYDRFTLSTRLIQASYVHNLLGPNCTDPVDLFIVYNSIGSGMEGALAIAKAYSIPTFNLYSESELNNLWTYANLLRLGYK